MMPSRGIGGSTERSTQGHITSSLGLVLALVPYPASVVRAPALGPVHHNSIRAIGGRVEPPAPADVVGPACGGDAALAPEGDPPRFLILRNPRPLEAVVLVEGHDVTHSGGVYTR
jgi:hypothetical protein